MRASQTLIVSLFNRFTTLARVSNSSRCLLTLLVLSAGFATPVPTRSMQAFADEEIGAVILDSASVQDLGEGQYRITFTGHVSGFSIPNGRVVSVDGPGGSTYTTTGAGGTFTAEIDVVGSPSGSTYIGSTPDAQDGEILVELE